MWPQIGNGLRTSSDSAIGDRPYMEDRVSIVYQKSANELVDFSYFGVFDGHGGCDAAIFACDNLLRNIVQQQLFKSDKDEDILMAISLGFRETHQQMRIAADNWPKHMCGLPSTSGTTASVVFVRNKKIYCGHVGDSSIVLGYEAPDQGGQWFAKSLTKDHKPEQEPELSRIKECGGKVVQRKGVPRVVWYRPTVNHSACVRHSMSVTEVPFLALARSLGDLWSYNSVLNRFIVSPDPDTSVLEIDNTFRCLILASDGLWNMISAQQAVQIVQTTENNKNMESSKVLVQSALDRWARRGSRADNTTALTIIIDYTRKVGDNNNFETVSSDNSCEIIEHKIPKKHISLTKIKKKQKRLLKTYNLRKRRHGRKEITQVSAS